MKKLLHDNFGISGEILSLCEKVIKEIEPHLSRIKETVKCNQLKVLSAFRNNKISETHFHGTTGYGYNDGGREAIDSVYAEVFGAEDALVRHNIINGTHAVSLCLFAVLRPGDTLVCATGKPYDTLEEAIGIRGEGGGSLKNFGINYRQAELVGGKVNHNSIMSTVDKNTKAVLIQKSKGYDWRPSLSNSDIGEIIREIKEINEDIVCIVDNCYGEFVERDEPCEYGADLVAGSLIKNPGGGLAPVGGYIVGKKHFVELCAYRLNSVGLGKHVGATLDTNKAILQGFFIAPHIVGECMASALFCGAVFKKLGFEICPDIGDSRTDIIQAIKLGSEDAVIKFCQGIQKASPIDSFVTPVPWDMPGYDHKVIMAAGTFTQGASIELSADAPIKPPYIAYLQGGLTFDSAYIGIMSAVKNLYDSGLIKI
ncbi:MAG: methionine gamma-lyase [Firmicutes bacterium ADurb.Bin193]|nr:MAG: methionine gamma-lyase [Firmicutes bacterium ADurb.Bin193]